MCSIDTKEGLELCFALSYYSRMRLFVESSAAAPSVIAAASLECAQRWQGEAHV